MALCKVTGTLYLPTGALAGDYAIFLQRTDKRVSADYLGSVVPQMVRVLTSQTGTVDFDILTGTYRGVARPSNMAGTTVGYEFSFTAPDAATALFQNCIDAIAPAQPTPPWLQRVEDAVADAEAAAQAAADTAASLDGAVQAINDLQQAMPLQDGSYSIVELDGAGDLIRIREDGLDMVPSKNLSDSVFRNGADSGPEDYNGGVVIEDLNDQPLRRLYPDGMDFIPSSRLIDRFKEAGAGGGGLTADGWATAGDDSFTAQAAKNGVSAVDRFVDRPDGMRLPVPEINGVKRKAVIISGYGQSLADVTAMADPLVWGTPPYPYHAFMLDDMNSIASGNIRGGMNGWSGVAVQRGTRMINASEALRQTQSHGSAALARLLMWDAPSRRVGMVRSSAWGGNRLVGTTPATGIWKDSNGVHTQSWANWTGDLQQSYDLLTAEGYEVEAIYILFHHQQADWTTPRAQYLSEFLGMKADRDALIASAFPTVKSHWFCGQAGGSGYRTGSYLGGYWPDRLAIVDACKPENGGNNITMVMPEYWSRTGAERGVTENTNVIHVRHDDRPLWGEHIAHAIHAVESGREWKCPSMKSATVSGMDILIDFDSMWPIVIDPTFCKVRPDMGFTVSQGAISVTGVRQTGQRQITVTCATSPAGTSVEYAFRQQVASDAPPDENLISTGAVRDAWEAPSVFDPYGRRVLRPALAGQIIL